MVLAVGLVVVVLVIVVIVILFGARSGSDATGQASVTRSSDSGHDRLVLWFCDRIQSELGVDPLADPVLLKRVEKEVHLMRKMLLLEQEHRIHMPFVTVGPDGPVHFEWTVTRAMLRDASRN